MAHNLRVDSTAAPSIWRPVSDDACVAWCLPCILPHSDSANDNFDVGDSANDNFDVGDSANDNFDVGDSANDNFDIGDSANDNSDVGDSANDNFDIGDSANDNFDIGDSANDNSDVGDSAQIAADLWAEVLAVDLSLPEVLAVDLSLPIAANIGMLPPTAVSTVSTVSTVSKPKAVRKRKADRIPRPVESKAVGKALLDWASAIKLAVVGVYSDAWFYPHMDQKRQIAKFLNISLKRVSNFCNNHRKRFTKIDGELVSSCALIRAEDREKRGGKK
jgi:hypothetical protein